MSAAAALSYYTIFSLPGILVLILLLVGSIMSPGDVQGGLQSQLQALVGPGAISGIKLILDQAQRPGGGLLPTVIGLATLLIAATGAFAQLQQSLNRTWSVEPDPDQGGIKNFLTKRLFSFGLILVIAFLLLVSLVISAVLSAVGNRLSGLLSSGISEFLLQVLNIGISLLVITLLFAAIFKVMPDAKIGWRSVWVGAGVTTLLFVIGKFLIGFYVGRTNPGEAYGAAGTLIILLLWIYYSSLILLFGAEFTETWADRRGEGIEPEPGAIRVERKKQPVESSAPRPA